jgi:hypothetical protein
MLQNAFLTDPGQYDLTDLNNNPITVLSVTTEQSLNPVSVVLTLGDDLVDERHYQLRILGGVITATLLTLSPDTAIFQWVENVLRTQIALSRFSGEVQTGLYGLANGLVFFSPALVNPAANSIIEVEDVDVCTKAFDEYHFPQPLDPPVLYTHGAGVVPTPSVTTLNSTASLWAKFPRLMEATITLSDMQEDTLPTPVDGPCTATMDESWDPAFISLMNNMDWKIFDNAGTPPAYFITANNLAPIPSGPPIVIILQP